MCILRKQETLHQDSNRLLVSVIFYFFFVVVVVVSLQKHFTFKFQNLTKAKKYI